VKFFDALMRVHKALALPPIGQMPEKHWTLHVDDHWSLYLNAASEPWTPCDPQSGDGPALKCGECYVVFNGWPAGILHPMGGCLAAGEAANEKTLCAALLAHAKKAGAK